MSAQAIEEFRVIEGPAQHWYDQMIDLLAVDHGMYDGQMLTREQIPEDLHRFHLWLQLDNGALYGGTEIVSAAMAIFSEDPNETDNVFLRVQATCGSRKLSFVYGPDKDKMEGYGAVVSSFDDPA